MYVKFYHRLFEVVNCKLYSLVQPDVITKLILISTINKIMSDYEYSSNFVLAFCSLQGRRFDVEPFDLCDFIFLRFSMKVDKIWIYFLNVLIQWIS